MNRPLTGLCYWPMVYPLRDKLKARVPIAATLIDVNIDALVVAVGSGCPFKLLLLYSDTDGLMRIKVWEFRRTLREIVSETCMSDLVPAIIEKKVVPLC